MAKKLDVSTNKDNISTDCISGNVQQPSGIKTTTKVAKVAWALKCLGGDHSFVDYKELVDCLWKSSPGAFSMIGYPQYPDFESVRKLRHKFFDVQSERFKLTAEGNKFIEENFCTIAEKIRFSKRVGEKRISSTKMQSADALRDHYVKRCRTSVSFNAFEEGLNNTVLMNDFFHVFLVMPTTSLKSYDEIKRKMSRTLNEGSKEWMFVQTLDATFRNSYVNANL